MINTYDALRDSIQIANDASNKGFSTGALFVLVIILVLTVGIFFGTVWEKR